jgi:hypothetical protein
VPSHFYHLVIDCHDPHALARFWSAALDQQILFTGDEEVIVGADKDSYPGLCFVTVPEGKRSERRSGHRGRLSSIRQASGSWTGLSSTPYPSISASNTGIMCQSA